MHTTHSNTQYKNESSRSGHRGTGLRPQMHNEVTFYWAMMHWKAKGKERKSIYIAPFCTKAHTKRSGMDHTVLPANNTMPAFPSSAFTRCHPHNWGSRHPIAAHYSFYWPRKDERLSWPGWLTCSGWFTHLSGHPSALSTNSFHSLIRS